MQTLSLFENSTDFKTFRAGEAVFRVGEAGDVLYVVQAGEIEIRVGEEIVETVRQGDLFGEMALIDGEPRSATAVALTEARIVPLDEKRFLFLVQQTPFFSLHVMRIMAHRLRESNRRAAI